MEFQIRVIRFLVYWDNVEATEIMKIPQNLTEEVQNIKKQTEIDKSTNRILKQNCTVLGKENQSLENRLFLLEVWMNKLNSSKLPSSDELMVYLRSSKHIVQTLAANEEYDKNLTLRLNEVEDNLPKCDTQNKNFTQRLNEVVNSLHENEAYEKKVTQQLDVVMKKLEDLKVQMRYISLSLLDVYSKTEELNTTLFRNYDEQIREVSARITNITQKVAFTAGVTSQCNSRRSGTLVFDKIVYNIGGGYDSSTGVFTAPVDGNFVFLANVQAYSNHYVFTYIVLNGSAKVTTMAFSGSSHQTYSAGPNLVVLKLQQGDRVWVKCYSGAGYHTQGDAPMTTFSGFQI
ncbi:uncharacterized protein LOC134275303 [Saccostrea cucullata]|uniref:uncharacterized protein LOC134275303 n=1 Tax=Saccostrea cuccullata TaxID=36930 RepID=UPI002ED1E81C